MAPTPCPQGKNSRRTSTSVAVGRAEVVGAGLGGVDGLLAGNGLQLLGVLLEVLGPVVAHDAAGLAGVGPADDGAVLGQRQQGLLVAGARPAPRVWR